MGEGGFGGGAARGVEEAAEGSQGEEEGSEEKSINLASSRPSERSERRAGIHSHRPQKLMMVSNTLPEREVTAYGSRRSPGRRRRDSPHATWNWVSAAYSGPASQITRLRPLRLAA